MDPSEAPAPAVVEVLRESFGSPLRVLEESGARVHPLALDEVRAVFTGHDHAAWAVRAAFAVEDTAERLTSRRAGLPWMRVGVPSGRVVPGLVRRGTRTLGVAGEASDFADLMRRDSTRRGVLVSGETLRLLPSRFDASPVVPSGYEHARPRAYVLHPSPA